MTAEVAGDGPAGPVKTDGRKRRWHQHKVDRRNELVDGTLDAIRLRGSNVSMDEIAAEIGVSKTVLYRYFVDKNDLTTAVMMRFAQTTLIPNMAAALSSNLQGYELTREVIKVYVETVAAEPEPYRFVMANNSASKNKVIANSEDLDRIAAEGEKAEVAALHGWRRDLFGEPALQLIQGEIALRFVDRKVETVSL
jgi:AcrR family transcriptional regulator